jgi:hypothetical protein
MQRLSGRLAKIEEKLGVRREPSDAAENPFDGLVEGRRESEPPPPVSIAQASRRRKKP